MGQIGGATGTLDGDGVVAGAFTQPVLKLVGLTDCVIGRGNCLSRRRWGSYGDAGMIGAGDRLGSRADDPIQRTRSHLAGDSSDSAMERIAESISRMKIVSSLRVGHASTGGDAQKL